MSFPCLLKLAALRTGRILLPAKAGKSSRHITMAGLSNLTEPLNMSQNANFKADGVHLEKVPDEEDIVARMNNLDPPVTKEEEKKLVRKIDLRLPPFLFVLYMFTWLDRGALGEQQ